MFFSKLSFLISKTTLAFASMAGDPMRLFLLGSLLAAFLLVC